MAIVICINKNITFKLVVAFVICFLKSKSLHQMEFKVAEWMQSGKEACMCQQLDFVAKGDRS